MYTNILSVDGYMFVLENLCINSYWIVAEFPLRCVTVVYLFNVPQEYKLFPSSIFQLNYRYFSSLAKQMSVINSKRIKYSVHAFPIKLLIFKCSAKSQKTTVATARFIRNVLAVL